MPSIIGPRGLRPAFHRIGSAVHKDAPDSMRAVAASVVVISHALQIVWYPYIGLGNWTHLTVSFVSETAVLIFFVLSGYLITASIVGNTSRNGRFRVWVYLRSRLTRIYPPLICAVLLSSLLFGIMLFGNLPGVSTRLAFADDLYAAREFVSVTRADVTQALTMQNGLLVIDGPLWSLYVEFKLYIVAGLVAFLLFGKPALIWRSVAVGLSLWVADALALGIDRSHFFYCMWWGGGASLFLLGRFGGAKPLLLLAGVFAAAIPIMSPTRFEVEVPRLIAISALSYSVFFRWTWGSFLSRETAKFSYTLYLVHFPIMIFAYSVFVELMGPGSPSVASRIGVIAWGIGVSFLCARFIAVFAEDPVFIHRVLNRSASSGQ